MSEAGQWTGRTRGGYWGNRFFVDLTRWLGPWPAYLFLIPVTAFYAFFCPRSVIHSERYLARVFGPAGFLRRRLRVWRHYFNFGVSLVDRLAAMTGRERFRWEHEGENVIREALAEGRGAILLAAHFGGWEAGAHLLERYDRPVNLVVLDREREAITRMMEQARRKHPFNILTADADPLRSVEAAAALRRGEIVAMHGDRDFGGLALEMDFLGARARFPAGAYLLGSVCAAPVVPVFVVRESLGNYRLLAGPVIQPPKLPRGDRESGLRACLAPYVEVLTDMVRRYPWQWANFYDYWLPGDQPQPAPAA